MASGDYENFHRFMADKAGNNSPSGLSSPEVVRDCALLAGFYLKVIAGKAPGQARCASVGGHGWRTPDRHLAEVFRPTHRLIPALWAAATAWPGSNPILLVRDDEVAGFASRMIGVWFSDGERGPYPDPPRVMSCGEFAALENCPDTVVADDVMDIWTAALEEGISGSLWGRLERCPRVLGVSASGKTHSPGVLQGTGTPVGLPDFLEGVFSTVAAVAGNPFGGADFVLYDSGDTSGRGERQDAILVMVTEALLAGDGDVLALTGTVSEAIDLAGCLEGPALAHGRTIWCGGGEPAAGPRGVLFVAAAPVRLPGRVRVAGKGSLREFARDGGLNSLKKTVRAPAGLNRHESRAPWVGEIVIASMPDCTERGWSLPPGIGNRVFAELALRRAIASCSQSGRTRVMIPSWLAGTWGPVLDGLVGWFGKDEEKK